MQIFLARTQGFCAGVARAIETVHQTLKKYGTPLYIFHEIVHNTWVVEDFKSKGVIFVDDLSLVPDRARIIFSAHGIAPEILSIAQSKHLKTIDATCPLVTKVHQEAIRLSQENIDVVLIGHKGHEEIVGTAGYVKPELLHIIQHKQDIDHLNIPAYKKVGFITQTTLSIDDTREIILKLRARFPHLIGPTKDHICYATQNRQDAIKELTSLCNKIIICGSKNSSNSNRLKEQGELHGIPTLMIDSVKDLDINFFKSTDNIGISSGASVPEHIVNDVVHHFRQTFPDTIIHTFDNPEKKISFPLPTI